MNYVPSIFLTKRVSGSLPGTCQTTKQSFVPNSVYHFTADIECTHERSRQFQFLREFFHTYCRGGNTVYSCFIHLSKAFERVNHKILLKTIILKGMHCQIVATLKCLSNNAKIRVEFNGQYSDSWRAKSSAG